jgi:DNA-binding response OmpR family regulator
VLSRTEILRQVFGYNFDPGTNIVDVHVAHLRRKLGESAALLETVRGTGYRLRESLASGS